MKMHITRSIPNGPPACQVKAHLKSREQASSLQSWRSHASPEFCWRAGGRLHLYVAVALQSRKKGMCAEAMQASMSSSLVAKSSMYVSWKLGTLVTTTFSLPLNGANAHLGAGIMQTKLAGACSACSAPSGTFLGSPAHFCCIVWKHFIEPFPDQASPDTCTNNDKVLVQTSLRGTLF